jgi:choline dehydrogenase-like flavoprotein
MIFDARTLPDGQTIEADICIVGAGVAGIALAREFIGGKVRVCLLESGGFQPDKATQSLYWGKNVGHPYYPLDTSRARFFGGTSHFWHIPLGERRLGGVRLRPLDPIDFETRDWVPYSGWPFSRSQLDPYYERALDICRIGPDTFEVGDWENPTQTQRLPLDGQRVETTIFQFGVRDPFFTDYRAEIEQSENVSAYLYANVLEVETDEAGRTVTGIRAATLDGKYFQTRAGIYVLALGGIETPRLMLLSNRVQSAGLGNEHDLVGRFFMEHPHLWSGIFVPADPGLFDATGLYRIHEAKGRAIMGKLTLSEEVVRRERLLNYCASLHPKHLPDPRFQSRASKGVDSLNAFRSALGHGELPEGAGEHLSSMLGNFPEIAQHVYRKIRRRGKIKVFRLNTMAEQIPNPESRVSLMTERDPLGQNRAQLNWQPTTADMRSIIRSQEIIGEELRRSGLGELYIELEDDAPPPHLHGGWHHMGTTRMHTDPKKGVVDENSRVHGLANLFIAGPSVFPTSGYANPVLTFLALTVRLADRVKKLLG